MGLSSDELYERWNRVSADAEVQLGLACASLSSAADTATGAWVAFNEAIERHCDASVDAMTPAQRDLYMSLIVCGTPRLDAICEAHDLAESSGG